MSIEGRWVNSASSTELEGLTEQLQAELKKKGPFASVQAIYGADGTHPERA